MKKINVRQKSLTKALEWFIMVLDNLSGIVLKIARKRKNYDTIEIFLNMALGISKRNCNPFHGDKGTLRSFDKNEEYKEFEKKLFQYNCHEREIVPNYFHPLLVELLFIILPTKTEKEQKILAARFVKAFADAYHLNCKVSAEKILEKYPDHAVSQKIVDELASRYVRRCMKRKNGANISIAMVESAIWLVDLSSMKNKEKISAAKRLLTIKLGCGQETFTKFSKIDSVRKLSASAYAS